MPAQRGGSLGPATQVLRVFKTPAEVYDYLHGYYVKIVTMTSHGSEIIVVFEDEEE